jgi:hypothetical protein
LLLLLKKQPQQIIFVIHVNHPRELDEDIWRLARYPTVRDPHLKPICPAQRNQRSRKTPSHPLHFFD